MPPPFAVETAPTGFSAALVGAVLTAIFYYDAAPFAVETAPTDSDAALVGAVLTAIFTTMPPHSRSRPLLQGSAPRLWERS
ncbi:hypothetical protein CXK97_04985 [Stutzerimonas stutzeri]|nr:hypothetical protein CXK97_04985 [Stutzerimonas stutzeri]